MESCRQVAEQVHTIATPIVQALELELVEVTCSGQGPRTVLRVFIDKPGGVHIGDCEEVHKSLSHALDIEDPIPHAYRLEVSSPGLDRPLQHRQEYVKAVGRQIRVKLKEPYEGEALYVGKLLEVNDTGIQVGVKKKKLIHVAHFFWENIARTQRDIEF